MKEMKMSHDAKKFPEVLSGLLSAIAGGDATVIPLELDGEGSIDDQVERAVQAAAARHRETCATCRELHAEFAKDDDRANTAGIPDLATFSKEELARQQKAQVMALEAKHAIEREEMIRSFEPKAKAPSTDLSVIGYMAFYEGRPIAESFDEDRQLAERGAKLAKMLRVYGAGELVVKPVHA